MADRIIALVALACLAGFLGIVALRVQRVDLFLACGIGLAMAAYDLWRQLGRRPR